MELFLVAHQAGTVIAGTVIAGTVIVGTLLKLRFSIQEPEIDSTRKRIFRRRNRLSLQVLTKHSLGGHTQIKNYKYDITAMVDIQIENWDKPGIYCWKLGGYPVYIGKAEGPIADRMPHYLEKDYFRQVPDRPDVETNGIVTELILKVMANMARDRCILFSVERISYVVEGESLEETERRLCKETETFLQQGGKARKRYLFRSDYRFEEKQQAIADCNRVCEWAFKKQFPPRS